MSDAIDEISAAEEALAAEEACTKSKPNKLLRKLRLAYPSADLRQILHEAKADPQAPWWTAIKAPTVEPDRNKPPIPCAKDSAGNPDDEEPPEHRVADQQAKIPGKPDPDRPIPEQLEEVLLDAGAPIGMADKLVQPVLEFTEAHAIAIASDIVRDVIIQLAGTASGVALRVAILGPEGKTQRQLAAEGGVSLRAIQKQLEGISRRLGVSNHLGIRRALPGVVKDN